MRHRTLLGAALGAGLLLSATGRAEAQTLDLSFLGCFTDPDTPVSFVNWGAYDPQILKVGVFYEDDPCHHYIAEVKVSPNTGANVSNTTANKSFTFDSISNDPIDSEEECESYRQSTIIFRKRSGTWSIEGFGRLRGTWVGTHCFFSPPAGESNFTQKKYTPPQSSYDLYRV